MEIAYLADRPQDLDRIALWQYGEWGYLDPHDSPGNRLEKLKRHLHRNSLPLTLVAVEEVVERDRRAVASATGRRLDEPQQLPRQALGSADLVHHEIPDRPDLTPWLSCVYVAPEHRGAGVGSALTRRAVREAARLGASTLYLCTWDRESFYRELGWTTIERFPARGRTCILMEIET